MKSIVKQIQLLLLAQTVPLLVAGLVPHMTPPALAYKESKPSAAPVDQAQIDLEKARKLLQANKIQQATPIIMSLLESSTDAQSCLNLANFTESFGFPLMSVRRACVNKALTLCNGQQDLLLVAAKAKQYQFYEITHQAITTLVNGAQSVPELYALADKATELSLVDVSHLALEKAFTQLQSGSDLLTFAGKAKMAGATDLCRKSVKVLIDGVEPSDKLCLLLNDIEQFELKDLNRYLLRKALDNAKTVDDYIAIREAARRVQESDVQSLADYRAKRQDIIEKINHDRADYQAKLKEFQDKVERDKQERAKQAEELQQAPADQNPPPGLQTSPPPQTEAAPPPQAPLFPGAPQPKPAQSEAQTPPGPPAPPSLFPGAPQPKQIPLPPPPPPKSEGAGF